ncbi:hypothetical protein, partial [Ruminococcus sp. RTP21358st1_A5_RTP21358_211008]|uniref:hypothetical protein n=2 Tax=Clostridia TaxID=186801 RepID=UPI0034A50AF0
QYNKPQQKAGANTSIILGHFQKRLTVKHKQKQKNPLEFPVFSTIIKNRMIIRACLKNYSYKSYSGNGVNSNILIKQESEGMKCLKKKSA